MPGEWVNSKSRREHTVLNFELLPWPPVANLVPSGWISSENIGFPEKEKRFINANK